MKEYKPTIITFSSHGSTFSAELAWDCDLEMAFEAFNGLLVCAEYSQEGVHNHVIQLGKMLENDEV